MADRQPALPQNVQLIPFSWQTPLNLCKTLQRPFKLPTGITGSRRVGFARRQWVPKCRRTVSLSHQPTQSVEGLWQTQPNTIPGPKVGLKSSGRVAASSLYSTAVVEKETDVRIVRRRDVR